MVVLPGAMRAMRTLHAVATEQGGIPTTTLNLVYLRASQINGCSVCVESSTRFARAVGESMDRLFAVAAWRDAPYFTDPERAALALTEAVTRLNDRTDPVPDSIWEDAVLFYDEPALVALILSIAAVNVCNRLNITTRQMAGSPAWN